jgi:hypothetical protein
MKTTITRHDFTATDPDMMTAAIALGLLDAIDLACLAYEHGANAKAILDEVSNYAEARRHYDGKTMSAWYAIRDAVYYFRTVEQGGEDHFGFKAEADAKASAVLEKHRVTVPLFGR